MNIKVAFVSLPKIGNEYILCEDCCGNSVAAYVLPSLILSCASASRQCGIDTTYIDLSIDDNVDLSQYTYVVYGSSWLYHDSINKAMSSIVSDKQRVIISIPGGYKQQYEKLNRSVCVINEKYETSIVDMLGCGGVDFSELSTDYTLIPNHYWSKYISGVYQVTRGCFYRCKFCSWGGSTVTDRRFIIRKPQIVAHDMCEIRRLSGRDIPLNLLCSQLTSNVQWLKDFASIMRDNPYKYSSNVNLSEITVEKLDLLKESGCISITAGLEGLSDKALSRVGKGFTLQTALNSISLLSKSGIPYKLHYRFGCGEDANDIQEQKKNLSLLRKAIGRRRAGILSFGPLIHYDGTMLSDDATYQLTTLDGSKNAMVQADIMWNEWIDFLAEAKRLNLVRGFRRIPRRYIKEWRKRNENIAH